MVEHGRANCEEKQLHSSVTITQNIDDSHRIGWNK